MQVTDEEIIQTSQELIDYLNTAIIVFHNYHYDGICTTLSHARWHMNKLAQDLVEFIEFLETSNDSD